MSEEIHVSRSEEDIQATLAALDPTKRQRLIQQIIAAALGSIPWVGGFAAAAHTYRQEQGQLEVNNLTHQWLKEHQEKLKTLFTELASLTARLNQFGPEIEERLGSEEYLAIVRKAFRTWDKSDTNEKRNYIVKLLANAGAQTACDDDVVRLFLDWLDRYHEAHFKVIREVYQKRHATRYAIWKNIHGRFPREDSAEADLFRFLIDELSQGRIIRQHRDTTIEGEFVRAPKAPKGSQGSTLTSAFEDAKEYELTALGRQFVHYVFSELVTPLNSPQPPTSQ